MSADGSIRQAIQVCLDINDQRIRKREIRGLVTACKKLGLSHGILISLDDQEQITVDTIAITVLPVVHFLCEDAYQ